jgi:hypothetical protein
MALVQVELSLKEPFNLPINYYNIPLQIMAMVTLLEPIYGSLTILTQLHWVSGPMWAKLKVLWVFQALRVLKEVKVCRVLKVWLALR